MYYELINEVWKQNNKKSALFNGSTYPIETVPPEFWNADRMPADDNPEYDTATHKLVGPQVIGDKVGYVKELLTPEEIEVNFQMTVPISVTMRQFRVALIRVGKLDFFKDKVALLDEEAKEIWLVAGEMRRDDPLIAQLGFTDKQVDNFFITANQLPR